MAGHRITLKDIARRLNLSMPTVSRALADHPDISAATKDRVREVAQALNYIPNYRARYLRAKHSRLIALVVPEMNMFFVPSMITGINRVVQQNDYSLIVFQSDNSIVQERRLVEYCTHLSADGVLLVLSSETTDLSHLDILRDCDIPVVLLDKTIDTTKHSTITIDDQEAGREAGLLPHRPWAHALHRHLRRPAPAHQRPPPQGVPPRAHRTRIPLADTQILRVTMLDELEGQLDRAFEAHPDLTAIFTMTDELLVYTHHLLMRRGVKIPDEVSLLAISDGQAPGFLHPNVTHFRHAGIEVGERTAHILIGMIEHNSDAMMDVRIRTTLVEMGSVATRAPRQALTPPRRPDERARSSRSARSLPRRVLVLASRSRASTTPPPTRATRRASSATPRRNTVQVYLDSARRARRAPLGRRGEREHRVLRPRRRRRAGSTFVGAAEGATLGVAGRARTMTYDLVADAPRVTLGWFLLGSMRVERDFQALGAPPAPVRHAALRSSRGRPAARPRSHPCPTPSAPRHLALLQAGARRRTLRERATAGLRVAAPRARRGRARVHAALARRPRHAWPSRSGPIPRRVTATRSGRTLTAARAPAAARCRSRSSSPRRAPPLTPLDRARSSRRRSSPSSTRRAAAGPAAGIARAHWMERQVRGVELLGSREQADGRPPDLRHVLRPRHARLGAHDALDLARRDVGVRRGQRARASSRPSGQVSHEEALGGQAVREAASEYVGLVDAAAAARRRGRGGDADSLLARARDVLRDHRRTRENYHMIDDELQLPVLAARWLADPRVSAARKRAFLARHGRGGAPAARAPRCANSRSSRA